MPALHLDGDVYVSPVHLAGPTFTGDPALSPLLDRGFTLQYDDVANVYVSSPDHRVRVGYLPEGEDDTLWKITAQRDPFGPPDWMATFNSPTPTELVTAFTSTLATHYTEGPDSAVFGTSRPAQTSWHPLEVAGWKLNTYPSSTLITAPDGLAGLSYSRHHIPQQAEILGERQRWLLWGGRDGYESQWYATFTTNVPQSLIAATTARLANPDAVLRYEHEVPKRHRDIARIRPVQPPVPTPLDVRRAAAARARSHGYRTGVGVPTARPPASSPSASLPVRAARRGRAAART